MKELTLQRIPFTTDADQRLRTLKARTGITPNILCRIGFCLSLEEPGPPPPFPNHEKPGREINRFTLLGKFDRLFVALLVSDMQSRETGLDSLDEYFVAHMNRGVELLTSRIKNLLDIAQIQPVTLRN